MSAQNERSPEVQTKMSELMRRMVSHPGLQSPGAEIGHANREAVRQWFATHIGGKATECSAALGLSVFAVGRHLRTIRQEWQPKRTLAELRELDKFLAAEPLGASRGGE